MPQGLNYELYFNIAFFGVIGLGFLIGYFRGLRKTLYSLIVLVLFYGFFFITIDAVVNQLWVLEVPSLFDMAAPYLPEIANETTLGGAVFTLVESYAGQYVGDTMTNEVFVSFVTGISLFVVKIIYAILYFTIGQILFRFVFYIIRVLFFSGSSKQVILDYNGEERTLKGNRQFKKYKKEEKRHKKDMKKMVKQMSRKEKKQHKKGQVRLAKDQKKFDKKQKLKAKKPIFGAFTGAAKGSLTAFVSIILLGGFLNITESFLVLLPEDTSTNAQIVETYLLSTNYDPYDPLYQEDITPKPMATGLIDIPTNMEGTIGEARNMIDGYNNNLFIQNTYKIKLTDENYSNAVPLNLYLFDTIFSFNIDEDKVLLRSELDTMANTFSVLLSSDYRETNDVSDITGEEITTLFVNLSESKFITSLIPLGIEIGSNYFETPLEIPIDELYAIDWASELSTLGAVAGTAFDLVNTAGLMDDTTDLTTVTLDGTEVRDLFDSLSQSEIATLGAYVALEPLLAQQAGQISAIITVPAGMVWEEEYQAFGEVAEAILNTNITVGQLQEGDPNILISALSDMDFTVLLKSEIVSHALRNIFDGSAGLDGLDMVVVPTGVTWFDVYDDDGNLVTAGELRNILQAVNAITGVATDFDFNNLSLDIIANFDDPTIDTIFDSELLVATISDYILNMDLGTTPLIIPDSVIDANNYLLASELKAVAKAAAVLVDDLACDEGDTACEDQGFDIAKAFSLSDTSIDTLTGSDILASTIGDLIIDQGGTVLTIPNSTLATISVDSVNQDVISKEEIKKLFKAVGVLGFTDLENMTFDASIIQNLGTEADTTILDTTKSNTLFDSKLVHATLSQMMFEQTEGTEAVLSVPYFAENGDPIIIEDTTDTLNYVAISELNNMLQSLLTLNITDFANVDSLDLNAVIADADTLLDSSILQATISKQVFDLGTEVILVPYQDVSGSDVRVTVGDSGAGTDTEYITESEIIAILDSLEILGITDINTFSGSVDLASITSDPGNITKMLLSATLHATISDQLIDQDVAGNISIPYLKEDDLTEIRKLVGPVGNEIEFIDKTEIEAMIDALDILGLTDVASFDGNVDLSLLTAGTNAATVLESSTIQATISKQIFDLGDNVVVVPYEDVDTNAIRVTVGDSGAGTETIYIKASEIEAMIDGLDILGITDVTTFSGTVDLASITSDPTNVDTLLTSATMHATISDQLIDQDVAGNITIPYFEEDDTTVVRELIGPIGNQTEFISKIEIKEVIDALNILELTDVGSFDGNVDLSLLTTGTNAEDVLKSSIIQATVSKQVLDLQGTTSGASFVVPHFAEDDTTEIRKEVGSGPTLTEYIIATELEAMIDGMDLLGITDVTTFDGSIDLTTFYDSTNRNILLGSSIMQGTISEQLIELGDGTLRIPTQDIDTNVVRIVVGDALLNTDFEYISKDEIGAMFESLEVLGITDIGTFSGTINLSNIYASADQDILLSSASMHATITKQMTDLGDATLNVPDVDVNNVSIQQTVASTLFVEKTEIKAMIEALEVLGIDDITAFNGSFDFTLLEDAADQDILLGSASIHRTITDKVIDLDDIDGLIKVPNYTQAGETPGNEIRKSVGTENYIIKNEIKALIDAFTAMGYNNLDTFGVELNSSEFFAERATILLSSTLQATLSDKLLNGTGGELIVPDTNINTTDDIRLVHSDVTYVDLTEIEALMDGLEALGLTDFGALTFDPSTVFAADFDIVLTSASLQATISNKILPNVQDETIGSGTTTLIVPTAFRETITVTGSTVDKHIEKVELKKLLESLEVLGVSDFNGGMDASTITSMTDTELDTLLFSSSVHTTVDSMMRGNPNIVVPALAENPLLTYANWDLTTRDEIKYFIQATQQVATGDFTNVNFDAAALGGLTVGQRDIVATSMIVRNMITPDLETLASNPLNPYTIQATDYMNDDTNTFLRKQAVLDIVAYYYD
ncbi:MAG: hypothetical protein K9L26_03345 [Candidatus Izimaplasma sp.]|nr:hypothetical protein [Candidatus Izimaplasma bacterium]